MHGERFGVMVKICKRGGKDITFMTEPSTFNYGIKKFEIDGESMYLLHSTKKGVLIGGKIVHILRNGTKKVVPHRQSNNNGIQRFNPVISI